MGKPKTIVTKQTCAEVPFLLWTSRWFGDRWQYVLVRPEQKALLSARKPGEAVGSAQYSRVIEYIDDEGKKQIAAGSGKYPPDYIRTWIQEQYDPFAINETSLLIYTEDDIRYCKIIQNTQDQPLGFERFYHRHEAFHYIKLSEKFHSTLAYRAGLKNFDRLIEMNGIDVQKDTVERLNQRFNDRKTLTLTLLVCDPTTYNHYKKNGQEIHRGLSTMQIVDTNTVQLSSKPTEEEFCVVQWENNDSTSVLSVNSISSPCRQVTLNGIYSFNLSGKELKGQILSKGTRNKCEAEQIRLIEDKENSREHPQLSHYYTGPECIVDEDLRGYADIFLQIEAEFQAEGVEYSARCIGCVSASLSGEFYKCLQCSNYELCPACFEKRHESRGHISGHAFVRFLTLGELFGEEISRADVTLEKLKVKFKDEKHERVTCDGCDTEPIIGLRFKCDHCYDYDLCINCIEGGKISKNHDKTHSMVLISSARLLEIDWSDIQLMNELGSGAFGTVYKAKWISKNKIVACKVISVPQNRTGLEQSFLKELAAYNELSGAYILQTFGHGMERPASGPNKKYMLVMEFMERGSLKSVIKGKEKLSIEEKLKMVCDVASGMRKLHDHAMIHRDIRPDNILVTGNFIAKIGDMGIARSVDSKSMEQMTMVGCQPFMPPEFYSGQYNQSLDVFTFGLTLYELFVGSTHEFDQSTFLISLPKKSPVFDDLIKRCTQYHAEQRPSAIEVETTLHLYRDTFTTAFVTKYPSYQFQKSDEKDAIFMKFYASFSPIAQKRLNIRFPLPPPSTDPEIAPKELMKQRMVRMLLEALIKS